MMTWRRFGWSAVWCACWLSGAWMSGCGDASNPTQQTTQAAEPRVLAFTSDRAQIAPGERAVLTWSLSRVTSVLIRRDNALLMRADGADAERGSIEVRPTQSTSYTLEAVNAPEGQRASGEVVAFVNIAVERATSPPRVALRATPPLLSPGQGARLEWTASEEAETLRLEGSDGTDQPLEGVSGVLEVRPQTTTAYTLRAQGASGTASASATVVVQAVPRITRFEVTPEEAVLGERAQVRWQTEGAERVSITANGRPLPVGDADAGAGALEVAPGQDTTYRLTATNAQGSTQASASVQVRRRPEIVRFEVAPSQLVRGAVAALSWEAIHADELQLFADESPVELDAQALASGRLEVTPTATTRYTLIARSPVGQVDREVVLEVVDPVEVVRFEVTPERVERGQPVTLSWGTAGATSVFIQQEGVGPLDGVDPDAVEGALELVPERDAVYTLTALGPGGSTQAQTSVDVDDVLRLVTFNVTPERIARGEQAVVAWQATGVEQWRLIALPGGEIATNDLSPQGGTLVVEPEQTTTYRIQLRAQNQEVEGSVTVDVTESVEIVRFEVTPEQTYTDSPLELSWETLNAATVTLRRGDDEPVEVEPRGTRLESADAGVVTWTLEAQGIGGTVRRSVTAEVIEPQTPEISSFTVAPSVALRGDAVSLDWRMEDATEAAITWTDQDGQPRSTTIGLSDLRRPLVPYLDRPEVATTYTLTASWFGVTTASASATVDVLPPVQIDAFTSEVDGDPSAGLIALSWSVSGADTLELSAVPTEGGEPVTVDVSNQLPAGRWVERPLVETLYTLTARNALDTQTAERVVQPVPDGPPLIRALNVEGGEVVAIDGEATLTWTLEDALGATLTGLDEDGDVIDPPWEVPPEALREGSRVIGPVAEPRRYILQARGLNNATVDRSVALELAPGPVEALRISEVLYDALGLDADRQWVELVHTGDAPVSLWSVLLAYGSSDWTSTVPLKGVLRPGGCWVIGGPLSSGANANPPLDQPHPFTPALGLAGDDGTLAEAIGLFLGPELGDAPQALAAVRYGGPNDPEDAWPDGIDQAPDASPGRALLYDARLAQWTTHTPPTPGLCFGLSPDPGPAATGGIDPQLTRGRRRGTALGGAIVGFGGFLLGRTPMQVLFGDSAAACTQSTTPGQALLCQVPPGTGRVDVTLSAADGFLVYPDWYTYEPQMRCRLEAPFEVGVATGQQAGDSAIFTARAFAAGLTDQGGPPVDLEAQWGYGPPGTDPAYAEPLWTWTSAPWDDPCNGCGVEARASTGPTPLPGPDAYAFVFRIRRTDTPDAAWVYCDRDGTFNTAPGSSNPFEVELSGVLDTRP